MKTYITYTYVVVELRKDVIHDSTTILNKHVTTHDNNGVSFHYQQFHVQAYSLIALVCMYNYQKGFGPN